MQEDLSILYEDIIRQNKASPSGYDILLDENITPTKIQYFFNRLFETTILFELFGNEGDVNTVYEYKSIKGGLEFKYENVIGDIKFYTIITLFETKHYSNKLEFDIMDYLRTNKDPTEIRQLKNVLDNNPDKYIIGFRFEDEDQLTQLTGKLKNKSVVVFGAVYRNIRNVLLKSEYINKIIAYYCLVSKQESKRLDLYKEIMKRTVKPQNMLVDNLSNMEYYFLYFW